MRFKLYGDYTIYEDGTVESYKRSSTPKKLTPYVDRIGYMRLVLNTTEKWYIHRLVATVFIDNPDKLPCINHIDGNKQNNHYTNLEWCTHAENSKHAYDNGLLKIDESRVDYFKDSTRVKALEILSKDFNQYELAIIFRVSQVCISKAIKKYGIKYVIKK